MERATVQKLAIQTIITAIFRERETILEESSKLLLMGSF
jgi:hypothetical protein